MDATARMTLHVIGAFTMRGLVYALDDDGRAWVGRPSDTDNRTFCQRSPQDLTWTRIPPSREPKYLREHEPTATVTISLTR